MTTPKKPAGRTLAEFGELKPAEKLLLEACRTGEPARISEERPEAQTADNTVRAPFLRFLALGGDEQAPVHERGVQLKGTWIEGELDMQAARIPSDIAIVNCYFSITPVFFNANISGSLILNGCQLPGLEGDRLVCNGSLFLRDGFTATGVVRLLSAQIGCDLSCRGAVFDGKDGNALAADSVVVKGNLLLDNGFTAKGQVRLLGAQIGGNLDCRYATFDGKDGDALLADWMVVKGAFLFQNLVRPVSEVSLASVHVGQLADDATGWGEGLVLDGFTYGSIAGGAPTDGDTRLAWLDKQRKTHAGLSGDGSKFRPQPWRQLIKVLREMGHAEDARQVAIAFEHRLREANLIGQTPKNWGEFLSWIYRKVSRAGHWLFGVFTGYGYRPLHLLLWMVGVWLLCAGIYRHAALEGVFAPSSPPVFQKDDYAPCKPDYVPLPSPANAMNPPPKIGNWYQCEKLPQAYPRFSPLMYSLDVLLPPIDLQQNKNWTPISPTPDEDPWYGHVQWLNVLKHFTRLVLWFEILFGWVSTLLLVAVVSGLTKRRED